MAPPPAGGGAPLALPVVLVAILGLANFLWQLDSSSLFIDEALSWDAADSTFPEVLAGVRA
nr:hypothetical protein [Thermoleophilaceae bacterium]